MAEIGESALDHVSFLLSEGSNIAISEAKHEAKGGTGVPVQIDA
jgi:hypothetical protein